MNAIIYKSRVALIRIGKALPFLICMVVLVSYAESSFALATDDFLYYDDMVIPNKPISWFIGAYFEYNIQMLIVLCIISVAIENPLPLKVVGLPNPTQIIQPYQFGEPYSKQTLLWLKGLPPLIPTKICTEHTPWMPSNTGGFSRGQGGSRGIAHDQKTASKTFEGIADAMAKQWSEYLLKC